MTSSSSDVIAPRSRRRFAAIFAAFQLYSFVQQGQERTVVLYVQGPLGWSPERVGFGLLALYGLAGLGSWPGIPMMQRCLGDLDIALLAVLSKLAGSALMAFARQDAVVYLAFVVQLFHLTPYAVVRSLVSENLSQDQQGSVYALLHCTQAVVMFLGPVSHTALFTATVRSMPGAVFIASGALLVFPLLLLLYVRQADRIERRVQVQADGASDGLLTSPTVLPPGE